MATRIINLIAASLLLSSCTVASGQSAREILNGMVAQYRSLSSYSDTGDVIVAQTEPKLSRLQNAAFQQPPRAGETLVSFRTYFARPKLFRFDWKSSRTRSRQATVWSDGKKVYEWLPQLATRNDIFTLATSDHLYLTIMEAAQDSSGAVYPLISLFIKEANMVTSFASTLEAATELAVVKEEPIEGETCYVVRANLSGAPWTLWISKQSKVLRKTRTVYSYGSFDESVRTGVRHTFVAEETRREIKVNESIPKDVFNYRPTLRKNDVDYTR